MSHPPQLRRAPFYRPFSTFSAAAAAGFSLSARSPPRAALSLFSAGIPLFRNSEIAGFSVEVARPTPPVIAIAGQKREGWAVPQKCVSARYRWPRKKSLSSDFFSRRHPSHQIPGGVEGGRRRPSRKKVDSCSPALVLGDSVASRTWQGTDVKRVIFHPPKQATFICA